MKFENINGLSAAEWIAAEVNNCKNEKEITEKIQQCLDELKLTSYEELVIFFKKEKEYNMEDINDELEKREIKATKEEKEEILKFYKEYRGEDDTWVYNLREAINTVLKHKEN